MSPDTDPAVPVIIGCVLFAMAIGFALATALIDRRKAKRERPIKRVRTVLHSERDMSIVGDGAWHRPRKASCREHEPRGM